MAPALKELSHAETEAGTQSPYREHGCVKTAGRANLNADWNGVRVLCEYSKSLRELKLSNCLRSLRHF